MNNRYLLFTSLLFALFLGSCDRYLDEMPSKSDGIRISTVEELEALLAKNNFNGTSIVDNNMASILCSDCFDLSTEYYDKGLKAITTTPENFQLASWSMAHTQNTNEKISMWKTNYEAIYLANLVLTHVEAVSGDNQAKETVKQKAHLLRAYNYLDLVQYYCLPYGKRTLSEPGLPLKRTTGYEEDPRRATLEETYRFIEADIIEAAKLQTPLYVDGERKSWKETGALANATAARFYLLKGEYTKALQHAEAALKYEDQVLDFRLAENLSSKLTISALTMSFVSVPSWWEKTSDLARYSGDMSQAYYWKQNYYLSQNIWGIPSKKLLDAYDKDYDLRYRYFIIPNFQAVYYFGMNALKFLTNVPGYATFNHLFSTAPNVAEMVLTKAECLARTGATASAMQVLNDFRAHRMAANTPADRLALTATDASVAVQAVLEERMREMPFTQRWNDIRRCNFNDDPTDDVVITRNFYHVGEYAVESQETVSYQLTPDSRTYAVAIPNADIVAGNGLIKQNRY